MRPDQDPPQTLFAAFSHMKQLFFAILISEQNRNYFTGFHPPVFSPAPRVPLLHADLSMHGSRIFTVDLLNCVVLLRYWCVLSNLIIAAGLLKACLFIVAGLFIVPGKVCLSLVWAHCLPLQAMKSKPKARATVTDTEN